MSLSVPPAFRTLVVCCTISFLLWIRRKLGDAAARLHCNLHRIERKEMPPTAAHTSSSALFPSRVMMFAELAPDRFFFYVLFSNSCRALFPCDWSSYY
jgi:hypothetical protein